MHRSPRTSLAALVAVLLLAAPAAAAPDRGTTVGPGATTFGWSAGEDQVSVANQFPFGFYDSADPNGSCGASGLPVGVVDYCDQTLVTVADPGTVTFRFTEAGDGLVTDWDMYVYEADAQGNAGDLLHAGEEIGGAETFVLDEAQGDYLVVGVPYQSVAEAFTAGVTWALPEVEEPVDE